MNRFILILLFFPFTLSAQTALIFHKSHSGSAKSFASTRFGNFGEPPSRLHEIIKLNDSTVIMRTEMMGSMYDDTMRNHPFFSNPELTADSLKKLYSSSGEEIRVTNFPEEPHYTPPPGQEHLPPLGHPDEGKKHKNKKHKKKKRADVGWLLLIGGGTFLGFGLLSATRNRLEKVAHA